MSASSSLLTALIAAATALVVALVTQFATMRRDRTARIWTQRRAALLDVQDGALELRRALAEYGAVIRRSLPAMSGDAVGAGQRRVEDALAVLSVRLTRVDDDEVITAAGRWRDLARYHSVSAEEVTTAEETAAWTAMNDTIGAALVAEAARVSTRRRS